MSRTADVVIMGGGIIGASIAYHLLQEESHRRVLVVEQDTTYGRAASRSDNAAGLDTMPSLQMRIPFRATSRVCPVVYGRGL
jgi:glycine/D-amino acid oxidase-like deaminating enzyme